MSSYIDWVRAFCLALPHATEDVQWEHDLLFRIAGKMFCVANLEPGISPTRIAFKCTPQKFAELVEIEGIIPAPYMARNHWVAMIEMGAAATGDQRIDPELISTGSGKAAEEQTGCFARNANSQAASQGAEN